jgi:FkbM family methyltransferase
MKSDLLVKLLKPFPPNSIYRRVGKWLCRNLRLSATQPYYHGVIYFDAVAQSWAFKDTPYEVVDAQLKDTLLALSQSYQYFIDIGCNIGMITLSILLRNKDIKAICVDPNARVLRLLKKSLQANHLEHRVIIKNVALGNHTGVVHFTSNISEMGHISSNGRHVNCERLADLINNYSSQKCLIKIDVEGFESTLLLMLDQFRNMQNVCLVLELHAFGYNEGNPQECVRLLLNSGATLRHLDGSVVSGIDSSKITQVIASWDK